MPSVIDVWKSLNQTKLRSISPFKELTPFSNGRDFLCSKFSFMISGTISLFPFNISGANVCKSH